MLSSSSLGNFMTFLKIKFYLQYVLPKLNKKVIVLSKIIHLVYISLINNALADMIHNLF